MDPLLHPFLVSAPNAIEPEDWDQFIDSFPQELLEGGQRGVSLPRRDRSWSEWTDSLAS